MTNPTTLVAEAANCCGGDCGCNSRQYEFEPLPDMTGIKIADLMSMSPALSRSMQRLVRSLDDPNGVISAFSSFVESPR